jgi:hypothetical protein
VFGVVGLGAMLVYAGVLAVTRNRSETIGLLAGETVDERRDLIMAKAQAITANVWMVAILAGFFYGLATEADYTGIFAGLAAVGAVAFGAALGVLSRRS